MGIPEPPEHWAPPGPLDATPVWKQYLLVAFLVLGFLGVAAAWAYFAVAPDLATPPALVPGNRVVVAVRDHPPGTAKRVDIAGPHRAFYLVRKGDDAFAVRAAWRTELHGGDSCEVKHVSEVERRIYAAEEVAFVDSCTSSGFGAQGEIVAGPARRDLDRYLVSRKDDRFVVTLDRLIQGAYRR